MLPRSITFLHCFFPPCKFNPPYSPHPQATGIRLGTVFQITAGFVAALIIAFVASWQLSLVLMLSFPLIAAVSFLQLRLIRGRTVQNKKLLEDSGRTAVESFENLRTVVGLGLGDTFCQIYRDQLAGPFR